MGTAIEFPDLSRLVLPRSIVLVGASDRPDSIGARTLENLTVHSQWGGRLALVNPGRSEIAGRPCVRSVPDLDFAPDVAIVAVRADNVLQSLEECGRKGARFAIVFTSGFGETGEGGYEVEARMRQIVRDTGMRIYGPNCPGLNNINGKLGMTFSPAYHLDSCPGPVGVASQGGGLGRSFIQSMDRGLGTGLWFSAGNEADLEVSDYIHYMAGADDIRVIATVLEGVRDGARFMAAALEAARKGKPIVALKIGKSDYGAKAAQSHTAAMSGSAEINSAVMREMGIVEVDDIDEMADVASLLARRLPTGREKIAVYCFSGGTVAHMADRIGAEGLELAQFEQRTLQTLKDLLPPYAPIGNPVDVTAEVLVNPDLTYLTLRAAASDPNTDLVVVPIPVEYGRTTVLMGDAMVKVQAEVAAPVVPVWMSDRTGEGLRRMIAGGLVPIGSVRNASLAFRRYTERGRWQARFDAAWNPLGSAAAASGTTRTLNEADGKALLSRAGIEVPAGRIAKTSTEAVEAVRSFEGRPVVMKIASADITHKSEVGGVRLGIRSTEEASAAFDEIMSAVRRNEPVAALDGVLVEAMLEGRRLETVVGIHRDRVFGHICTFGLGGVAVELFKDVSRRLLPLTPASARAMVEGTRCHALLAGHRGQAAFDVEALVQSLLKLSDFVARHEARIEELEINPLAVRPVGEGVAALDAVITYRGTEPLQW